MIKKIKLYTLCIIVLCFPINTYSAVPVIHPTTLAVDAAIIAIKQFFNSLLESIVDLERDVEEELAANKKDTAATIETVAKAEAASFAAVHQNHAVAMNVMKNNADYSPLAQSSYACCGKNLGIGLVNGKNQEKIYQEAIHTGVKDYNNQFISNEVAYDTLLPAINNTRVDQPWAIFPLHETSTDDPEDIAGAIILNTNPLPVKTLPNNLLNTAPGQHYEVLRKIQLGKMALPQGIMSEVASHQTPSYPLDDWLAQMEKARGIPSGTSEAVVNGKLSADAVLKTQVYSRYGNPNYGVDLHRKYPSGLLREMIEMETINLEIQRRLLVTEEQRLALFAQDHASQIIKQYDPQLVRLKGDVIMQQVTE